MKHAGIIKLFKGKKLDLLDCLRNTQDDLIRKLEDFSKKDTYLTYFLMHKFLEDISLAKKCQKIAWYLYLSKEVRDTLVKYLDTLNNCENKIGTYNKYFIEKRLTEHKNLFDGKEDNLKINLHENQRRAIVKDDKHNLLIAPAGSGKTVVLTSKIVYLTRRKDKIDPKKILVLAFNRNAVEEIKRRLEKDYKIKNINVMTFHKLGRKVISETTNEKINLLGEGEDNKIKEEIKILVNKLLEKKEYQEFFLEYLSSYLDEEVLFEDKAEYHEYMINKNYLTLDNKRVKSIAERDIANFFFSHNIEYEYEPKVDWIENSEEDKEYHPDFYLPDFDIYIEHWGLDKNNKVPNWFEGENPTEKYLENKKWKLEQFKKYDKTLVESWDFERKEKNLIPKLMENLKKKSGNISFNKLSYKEIVEKSYSYKENKENILDMIYRFVNLEKVNLIDEREIRRRINSNEYSKRQKLFAEISLKVFLEYQSFLKETNQIDFNDMINRSVELLKKNPEKYKGSFEYILVDEFQDISKPRLELIKSLVGNNEKTKLFVVGDDWQSINGFAGSEIGYFIDFEKEFNHPEKMALKINYRSTEKIVQMSNKLISYNKDKIEKQVFYDWKKNKKGSNAKMITLPKSFIENQNGRIEKFYQFLKEMLEEGIHPTEILVLSRFNLVLENLKRFCEIRRIPIKDISERKNGITFLTIHRSKGLQYKYVIVLDVVSGTYGFPSEMKDDSVLEIAKIKRKRDSFEEERRLFYVALTRSKEFISFFTVDKNKSIFLKEISNFIKK